jgi:hypothetical protein
MLRFLPWIIAFALVLGAGVVQGLHTDRWSTSAQLATSAAKLEGLSFTLGDWQGEDEKKQMEDSAKELAEIVGYKMRIYRNTVTGAMVRVLIMCGRPGPIAVHTPDICFGGAGYRVFDEETKSLQPAKESPAMEFKTARFVREDALNGSALRIYWGWTTDGTWSAPKDPRWTFASAPALFKLYVMWDQSGNVKAKEYEDFLGLLLKDLQFKLSPAS